MTSSLEPTEESQLTALDWPPPKDVVRRVGSGRSLCEDASKMVAGGEVDAECAVISKPLPAKGGPDSPVLLAQTVGLCLLFMAAGPALILANSRILNQLGLPFPAAVSALGLFTSSAVVHILVALKQLTVSQPATREFLLTRVMPIGMLSASTIVLGNAVYLELSVAFIQMLKALTPVYVLGCMMAFRLEEPRVGLMLAVLVISGGTSISAYGQLNFSFRGVALQCLADLFEGLRLVLQDLLLKQKKLTPVEMIFFINPAAFLFQMGYVFVMERDVFKVENLGRIMQDKGLLPLVCFLGLAVNALGFLVMERTNGLVLKVLSIVRSNALVVGSFLFLPGNHVTEVQWLGYAVSMAGVLWYVIIKQPKPKGHVEVDQKVMSKV